MSYQNPRFTNPWANHTGFINLGHFDYGDASDGSTHRYDLYAIFSIDCDNVSFGARYGEEGSHYLSSEAYLTREGDWKLLAGLTPTATAAARFFANHHHDSQKLSQALGLLRSIYNADASKNNGAFNGEALLCPAFSDEAARILGVKRGEFAK